MPKLGFVWQGCAAASPGAGQSPTAAFELNARWHFPAPQQRFPTKTPKLSILPKNSLSIAFPLTEIPPLDRFQRKSLIFSQKRVDRPE